jgi:hypothetical protein
MIEKYWCIARHTHLLTNCVTHGRIVVGERLPPPGPQYIRAVVSILLFLVLVGLFRLWRHRRASC